LSGVEATLVRTVFKLLKEISMRLCSDAEDRVVVLIGLPE
jgi:hypothetical protein